MVWKETKCLFIFPLRKGLLVFEYIKLILNYINIVIMLFRFNDIFIETGYYDPISYIELSLAFGVSIIDLIFNIILLAGLHKNSITLLDVCYEYNIVILIVQIATVAFYLPLETYRRVPKLKYWAIPFCFGMFVFLSLCIVLQTYIVTLLKSLRSEFKNKQRRAPETIGQEVKVKQVKSDLDIQLKSQQSKNRDNTNLEVSSRSITIHPEVNEYKEEKGLENLSQNVQQSKSKDEINLEASSYSITIQPEVNEHKEEVKLKNSDENVKQSKSKGNINLEASSHIITLQPEVNEFKDEIKVENRDDNLQKSSSTLEASSQNITIKPDVNVYKEEKN